MLCISTRSLDFFFLIPSSLMEWGGIGKKNRSGSHCIALHNITYSICKYHHLVPFPISSSQSYNNENTDSSGFRNLWKVFPSFSACPTFSKTHKKGYQNRHLPPTQTKKKNLSMSQLLPSAVPLPLTHDVQKADCGSMCNDVCGQYIRNSYKP